ncbi:MAG: glycosyltransferase [Candidatus Gastranaerophilales bacterium]|nr:glycosyltransferase [Candidatus Gastranaerophilales bacterium]
MLSQVDVIKKPKVAIIHPAIGESIGGSQIFVLELAEKLKDRCDITIFSSNKVNELCHPVFSISRKQSDEINHRLFQFVRKLLGKVSTSPDVVIEHITSFLPVFYQLMSKNYDVIYPNNNWGGLLVASAVRHMKGTPVLFTEHGGFMENGKIASRNLGFKPDKYIVLSEEMKFWVKKYFPESNVGYIPNGVDFGRFNPDVESKIIDLPKPLILTASRYYPNKRLELVIEAVASMKKGSLLMLSSGDNLDLLNKKGLDKLGEKRFRLISADYKEMASYYKACDVFTLPSMHEPFGLVYLEAMACNKPVVAPYDHSRMDIIGDAGILCDVTDIDVYADALKRAAKTNFGSKPYYQAGKYTWESCADKYYSAIMELISAKVR